MLFLLCLFLLSQCFLAISLHPPVVIALWELATYMDRWLHRNKEEPKSVWWGGCGPRSPQNSRANLFFLLLLLDHRAPAWPWLLLGQFWKSPILDLREKGCIRLPLLPSHYSESSFRLLLTLPTGTAHPLSLCPTGSTRDEKDSLETQTRRTVCWDTQAKRGGPGCTIRPYWGLWNLMQSQWKGNEGIKV